VVGERGGGEKRVGEGGDGLGCEECALNVSNTWVKDGFVVTLNVRTNRE